MAKIYNVLRYVDDIKPNRFTDDTKVQWLNEVEGYIQTEVMMLALADVVQYDPETHMHTDLLVKPPHDKLYALYLCAMIDFANGEYDKYANTMQLYNEFLGEYIGWYTLHFRPADGGCVREGYYLSAYALAVVNGFEGSEAEWIASLNGKPGADAYELAKEHGYTGTREKFGQDQAQFAENAAQVRQDRESASQSAHDAETAETNAATSATSASASAESARASAESASTAAVAAGKHAGAALGSSESAADSARNASESAATAARIRESVERTAENIENTVQETLQQAKDSGEFDGEDGITPHIGENENWYIGNKDTGVRAKGKSGVHVGGDAPPAGTRVWVNPSGKGTKIPQIDETLTKAGYAADAAKVGEKFDQLSGEIVNKDQGEDNAGKLLYVGADGVVTVLTLGSGLEIKNGVLTLTNATVASAICGRAICGEIICGGV